MYLYVQEYNGSAFLSESQQNWVNVQKILLRMKAIAPEEQPTGFRLVCYRMARRPMFGRVIIATILFNSILMTLTFYHEPTWWKAGHRVRAYVYKCRSIKEVSSWPSPSPPDGR